MHHFLSYDTKTGTVSGYVQSSNADISLVPRNADEAYVQVKSDEHVKTLSALGPEAGRVLARVEGGEVRSLKIEPAFLGSIVLSCDRPDLDRDGLPEVPADGQSAAHVTAQLVGNDKKPVKADGLRVDFRVTRGMLSKRSQVVVGAECKVELRSTTETVRAEVTASANGYKAGRLALEFIPTDEHLTLQGAAAKKAP